MKTGKMAKEDLKAELVDMEKIKLEIDILYRESREENKKEIFTLDQRYNTIIWE
jgi:hypothetical protein